MKCFSMLWMLSSGCLLLAILVDASEAHVSNKNGVKTSVFLSPPFILGPGTIQDSFFYNIDFPRGHIALKDFNAEIVDEAGNSVPLYDTYLHHWIVIRYRTRATSSVGPYVADGEHLHLPDLMVVRNEGICQDNTLVQYFGFGAESRGTLSYVPDPYGLEVGNPAEIPDGYEERWMMNVHAIDTRGAVDRIGCIECRCDVYNSTTDGNDRPLPEGYKGGIRCCPRQRRCKVKEGMENVMRRNLYLRYTVKYVDWDESIVPVKIYVFDVTDTGERSNSPQGDRSIGCQVEYQVDSCAALGMKDGDCVHKKKKSMVIPVSRGGNVIYGVGHQHVGGLDIALYGQDGRLICFSKPIYGDGKEAGNEEGYVVGMSTCYPEPGSVKVVDGELLTVVSNYNNTQMHNGVMGLFYILVEETKTQPMIALTSEIPALMK